MGGFLLGQQLVSRLGLGLPFKRIDPVRCLRGDQGCVRACHGGVAEGYRAIGRGVAVDLSAGLMGEKQQP